MALMTNLLLQEPSVFLTMAQQTDIQLLSKAALTPIHCRLLSFCKGWGMDPSNFPIRSFE